VLLAAGRTALEVGAQAGHGSVGVRAGDFELDVAVELLEARVAVDFGAHRPAQPGERLFEIGTIHHSSSQVSSDRPHASRCCRSLRRASCSVL
jgi:hypothetical protein